MVGGTEIAMAGGFKSRETIYDLVISKELTSTYVYRWATKNKENTTTLVI